MSTISIILLIIALVIVVILIKAAMLSTAYSIERSIQIHKTPKEVYDYIKYLKNAEQYNKWVMTDPAMKKEYRGADGTVGFVYAWDSNNKQVGKGEQEIKGLTEAKQVDYEIRFIRPFAAVSPASITLTPVGSGDTNVSWSFRGTRNFAMKIFHTLFNLSKALGNDLYTSLTNLKNILEKK